METHFVKSCLPSRALGLCHPAWVSHPAPAATASVRGQLPWEHLAPAPGHLVTPPPLPGSPDADIPRMESPDSRADPRVRPSCGLGRAPQAFQLPCTPQLDHELLHPPQRQTWVFQSKEVMLKSGSAVPEGTLVYVREGSSAFLRTPTGWSRLLVPCTEDAPRGASQGGGSGLQPWQPTPGWIWCWGSRAQGRSWFPPNPSLCSLH